MAQFTFDHISTLAMAPTGTAPVQTGTPVPSTPAPAVNNAVTVTSQPGTVQVSGAPTTTSQPAPAGNAVLQFLGTFGPMILIFVLLYFILFHGQRKEEKKRKAMIAEMKKGDDVMTIGGLVGKVHDIKDDRVVIKIDEANNVKATYLKSAIQRVLRDDDKK